MDLNIRNASLELDAPVEGLVHEIPHLSQMSVLFFYLSGLPDGSAVSRDSSVIYLLVVPPGSEVPVPFTQSLIITVESAVVSPVAAVVIPPPASKFVHIHVVLVPQVAVSPEPLSAADSSVYH